MADVLVTGATGQVGSELVGLVREGWAAIGLGSSELDITDADAISEAIGAHRPAVIVNCAAYTDVDRAEDHVTATYAVNRDGPALLATACRRAGIALLHLSTDYVFGGDKAGPYTEADEPAPLSVYGASKAAGEAVVRENLPEHVILRASWIFGRIGRSFVDTIVRLAGEQSELRVVEDQSGCPSAATWVARVVADVVDAIVAGRARFGTYHLETTPVVSRFRFAQEIVARAIEFGRIERSPDLIPVRTRAFPTRAKRPKNSAMDGSRLLRDYGIPAGRWQDDLRDWFESR